MMTARIWKDLQIHLHNYIQSVSNSMPKHTRCRNFTKNGSPISGGCKENASHCRFMHPEDSEFWEVVPARCKYFDENKKPVRSGCRYINHPSECLYAHPGEPEWEGKRRSDPRLKLIAPSSNARSWDGDRLLNSIPNRGDRRLQVATSTSHAVIDNNRDVIPTPVTVESAIPSPTTPLVNINMPPDIFGNADSDAVSSTKSNDIQMWRTRIGCIAHAMTKYQELKEEKHALETSKSLLRLAPPHSRSELEEQIKKRHSKIPVLRRELEAIFYNVYRQLHSTGFWSFPLVQRQGDDGPAELLKEIEAFKERVTRVDNLMKMRQEKRRKQAEKINAIREERPSFVAEHEGLMKRITDLEKRLQSLEARTDDQEDEFECDHLDWSDQMSELKNSHIAMKDQELALDRLTSGLDDLSKELVDFTYMSPSLNLTLVGASDIKTRITSLVDARQVNADEQMRQVFQDLNQHCLDLAKPNPVLEALQTVKTDIMSEVDMRIDELRLSLLRLVHISYHDAQRDFESQVDPVADVLKNVSKDFAKLNLNCL